MNDHASRSALDERMSQLEEMLGLTRAIHEHLDAGDWEMATTLEMKRRPLLERFFESGPAPQEEDRVRETLAEILEINNRIVGLGRHIQRGLAMKAAGLSLGRQAVRAYAAQGT